MRLRRRNTFMLVWVNAKNLKFPIVIPLPIAIVEELLKAAGLICGLCTPWIRRSQLLGDLQKKANALSISLSPDGEMSPWRMVAAMRQLVTELRCVGPLTLVDIETSGARVLIKFI